MTPTCSHTPVYIDHVVEIGTDQNPTKQVALGHYLWFIDSLLSGMLGMHSSHCPWIQSWNPNNATELKGQYLPRSLGGRAGGHTLVPVNHS